MKKDTIIRVVSIVGVFGVLYFIYKKMTNQKSGGFFSNGGGVDGDVKEDPKNTNPSSTNYEKYTITTQDNPLRIRETPSDKAKISGKLNKGQEVLLKPSSTQGWMEYSTNGTTTFGYVSSQFVTKK
tara:strand:+ start:8784 stop:9161 length:378 start_codon:yes stop_codon:yes gene_type:complete